MVATTAKRFKEATAVGEAAARQAVIVAARAFPAPLPRHAKQTGGEAVETNKVRLLPM